MLGQIFKALFQSSNSSLKRSNLTGSIDRREREEECQEKYNLSRKAHVIVINNYRYNDAQFDRVGSELDMDKIREFFRFYRTDPQLEVHENLPLQEIRQVMDRVNRKDFRSYSCVIVIIMSRGNDGETMLTQDGGIYFLNEDVVAKVASNPTLDGKPKIFIVNTCRGVFPVIGSGQIHPSQQCDTVIFQNIYEEGNTSDSNREGLFFVNTFFDLLRQYDHLNICDLNRLIIRRASMHDGNISIPTMASTLGKIMIFRDLQN